MEDIRKSRMDVDTVRRMLKDGYSIEDIQKHYGYKRISTVKKFMRENGINPKIYAAGTGHVLTEADNGTIGALYTSGRFSLKETAAELGTSKKALYEYLRKNPKLIPVGERR